MESPFPNFGHPLREYHLPNSGAEKGPQPHLGHPGRDRYHRFFAGIFQKDTFLGEEKAILFDSFRLRQGAEFLLPIGGEETQPLHLEVAVPRVQLPAGEALAPPEGVAPHLFQAGGKADPAQLGAVLKGPLPQGNKSFRQLYLLDGALPKGSHPDGAKAGGEGHLLQLDAAEGVGADAFHPLRQTYLPQAAIQKSLFADGAEALGEMDLFQHIAPAESLIPDGDEALRQADRCHPTVLESSFPDFGDPFRDDDFLQVRIRALHQPAPLNDKGAVFHGLPPSPPNRNHTL